MLRTGKQDHDINRVAGWMMQGPESSAVPSREPSLSRETLL